MKTRAIAMFLGLTLLLTLTSCGAKKENPSAAANTPTTVPTTQPKNFTDPLTGLDYSDSSAAGKRPVAVMINNIKKAQSVQTGLNKASMVFETLVEGGITRLMAVYSDVNEIPTLGTIRSARYSFAELALGLDAVYIHCGADDRYCTPMMEEHKLGSIDINGGVAAKAGHRYSNGLATEHTLYTNGEDLADVIKELDRRTDIKDAYKNLYKFNKPEKPVVPGTAAEKIRIRFSGDYISTFSYDETSKMYERGQNGDTLRDYRTGKTIQFKNIFVLFTEVKAFSDNEHMKSDLDSGSGYYLSEGGYTPIKWSKGDATSPLKFTTDSGEPLTLNAGRSYIGITDTDNKTEGMIE